ADALQRDIRCGPILVATSRGRIVGAVYVQWRKSKSWPDRRGGDALYVRRLVIARRVAGQGVADALLLAVAAIARRHHRANVRLTSAPLEPMARIYHRLGFTLVDEVDTGPYSVFRFERQAAPFRTAGVHARIRAQRSGA
ncbi:MAG TPA: GNAT family N-acetyltransferase, partial [Vineibacter sp.]|nr:GNAT family N-acetyltransferase [Vineibacter sp.]